MIGIPLIKTKEDILTVMRQNRRWRRKNRVAALRAAKKQLMVLRMRGDIDSEEAFRIRQRLIPMLKREDELLARESLPEVTPAALRFARENDIDLKEVDYRDRITIRDVRAHVKPTS